jgi:ubiquinone/menaquinone biosynthesis C-methylase UbiE
VRRLRLGQRFARLVTNIVVRRPALWRLFRRPLTAMFDAISGSWDGSRVTPQHLLALEAALDALDPPRRVLDLGTGTGAAARAIAARWPDAEITGADLSEGMIREAQARAGARERYVVADASALPFETGAFDLVTMLNMIPFFDELARVTAPGGRVAVAFSNGSQTPIWVPFDRLRSELERHGFADVAELSPDRGASLLARRVEVS